MANTNKRRDSIDKYITTRLEGGVSYTPTINDINEMLASQGERILTRKESKALADIGAAIDVDPFTQFWRNIIRNSGDVYKGVSTFGTAGVQYGLQGLRKLRDALMGRDINENNYPVFEGVNDAVGSTISGYTNEGVSDPFHISTTAKLAKGGADLLLSPLYLSVDDLKNTSPKDIKERLLPNALFGLYNNPIDNLPIYGQGFKLLPKGTLPNLIHRLPIPQGIKNAIPTPAMEEVNRIIADTKVGSGVRLSPIKNQLTNLRYAAEQGKFNPEDVVRNLRTGAWEGNKATLDATEKMSKISQAMGDMAYQLGVPRREMDDVVRANALLERLDPNRTLGIQTGPLQSLINRFESGANVANELNKYGFTDDSFESLISSMDKALDEGRLAHLSQVFTHNVGDAIPGNATARPLDFLSKQALGTATNKEIADSLFDTYDFLGRRMENALASSDAAGTIARELGKKVDKGYTLGKGEAFISPTMIREAIKEGYSNPGRDLSSAIKTLNSDSPSRLLERFGNDLYAIDENLIRGLINSQTNVTPGWLDSANSTFKAAQLTTPKFVTDNRLGNTLFNAMEGVTPIDYIDAWANRSIMPSKLKEQTSYAGFLGKDFVGSALDEATKRAVMGTIGPDKAGIDRFKNFNLIFANPVISAESTLEGIDRYANMIRQAKRAGGDWKDVISKAETDPKLYRELNKKVDNSLGDYAGRNYFLNPTANSILNVLYNFYKYPAQSARVMWNQAQNRPLSYATMVTPASVIGQDINNAQEGLYQRQLPKEFAGGLVAQAPTRRGGPWTIDRYQASPITAPLEVLHNAGKGNLDKAVSLSPILNDVNRIINFENSFGSPATTPNATNSSGNLLATTELGTPTRDIYKPSLADRMRLAGSIAGNQFVVPVVQMNRWVHPWQAYLTGEPYYRPYDTSLFGQVGDAATIPFLSEGNKSRPSRQGFEDLMENMVGLQRYRIFPDKELVTPANLKQALRYNAINRRELENR